MNETASLCVSHLKAGYGKKVIIEDANFSVPKGKIVSIVGPNGCGKSTVLRSITGHLPVMAGEIRFDRKPITTYAPKVFARKVAYLSQTNTAPEDMSVRRLVSFGRVPYRKWGFSALTADDKRAIDEALHFTGIDALRDRPVSDLSGGERQRVWLSMVIAQEPEVLLLDEPTTYLDVSHQLEIMELLRHLNETRGTTIVMVLHDLNHAIKYSDQMIVMRNGAVYASGTPQEVSTLQMLEEVYGLRCVLGADEDGRLAITSMKLCKEPVFTQKVWE